MASPSLDPEPVTARNRAPEDLWSGHHEEWRDPAQVTSHWEHAAETDPKLLRMRASGAWWETLERCGVTLVVTREYEHLLMALSVVNGAPRATFMRLPHPSGLAFDARHGVLHVASTRNPNQIYELRPVKGAIERFDMPSEARPDRPLVPVASRFHPGCLYIHDLALVGGELHANAVGLNAVVRLSSAGGHELAWWPRSIERGGRPDTTRNYLQLNSIAAGRDLTSSFFSASSDQPSARRPGHRNYPVDGRGVVFSGRTREPIARGLTRPHSARMRRGRIWVDNSGYGEVGVAGDGVFEPVARLAGWTRGLCFAKDVAFVGTSRVIPRFRQYAPGLDVPKSMCAVHAVDTRSGAVIASLRWPYGNQIFAIEALPVRFSLGLPFRVGRRPADLISKRLFYGFRTSQERH